MHHVGTNIGVGVHGNRETKSAHLIRAPLTNTKNLQASQYASTRLARQSYIFKRIRYLSPAKGPRRHGVPLGDAQTLINAPPLSKNHLCQKATFVKKRGGGSERSRQG